MRGLVVVVLAGCGGAPTVPARLEEIANIPQSGQDTPATFDLDNTLILMDGNTGLRRLFGTRLDVIPGGQVFTFGSMGVDRDGTILLSSFQSLQLTRFEPGDRFVNIVPAPPSTPSRSAGLPSGAYHVVIPGQPTTFVLPAGGTTWTDSMRQLDRTLRAPDGEIYAVVDGDIARLDASDAAEPIASCAEFAGGTCPGLELAGFDAAGHLHMSLAGDPEVHILDVESGAFRQVVLPGGLVIERMVTGTQHALVLANDPDRNDERSLWWLDQGADQLLRFATLGTSPAFAPAQLLADREGNTFVITEGKLQQVIVEK